MCDTILLTSVFDSKSVSSGPIYYRGKCYFKVDSAIGGHFSEPTSPLLMKQKFGEENKSDATIPVTGTPLKPDVRWR